MYKENREFMKATNWALDDAEPSDQEKGIERPEIFKSYTEEVIKLPSFNNLNLDEKSLSQSIVERRSRRKYTGEEISLEELSYLTFLNCGVTKELNEKTYLRAYPSGGNRQGFETYLYIQNVIGLEKGVYRYIPLEHGLIKLKDEKKNIGDSLFGQNWADKGAVTFIWTVIPYRGEWRYQELSHKVLLLDAGHLCQNLYLACEAIGLGTCAIGSYEQSMMDDFVGVDGEEEFVVYLSPVGKYE